jgi:tetratricopeptide (TPR) repeat protein
MISSYERLGEISIEEKNMEQAKKYFSKSLSLCKENNDLKMTAATYMGLGQVSESEKDYNRALEYHMNSLSMFEQLGDKMGIADGARFVGIEYANKNDFKKASPKTR